MLGGVQAEQGNVRVPRHGTGLLTLLHLIAEKLLNILRTDTLGNADHSCRNRQNRNHQEQEHQQCNDEIPNTVLLFPSAALLLLERKKFLVFPALLP